MPGLSTEIETPRSAMNAINRTVATACLYLLASASAFCGLGESPDQVEARYGPGEMIKPRFPNTSHLKYNVRGAAVFVDFMSGKSIREYHKRGKMPDREIAAFLKDFSSGQPWAYSDPDRAWSFNDLIAHREKGHDDWLWIETREALSGGLPPNE